MSESQTFDQRVHAYLDGEITPESFDLFCAELSADPLLRQRFFKLSALDSAIAQVADDQDRHHTIEAVLSYDKQEAGQEIEEDSVFRLYQSIEPRVETWSGSSVRTDDILPLAGYAARLALRNPHVIKGLVAAAMVMGLLLAIALISSQKYPQSTPLAHDSATTVDRLDEARELVAVASLTGERDAVWDRRPGQDLFAGQRLTLTQGFAEITTNRGAVAILQAPATVEFTDNDNAIRLHAGKLVGICETPSSKGFLVRTPHMDITDIGTEFGVQVNGNRVTATVITGEIEVATPSNAPQRLTQDQTAWLQVTDDKQHLIVEDQLAQGFEELLPREQLAEALRNDPAMIAYYGFEAEDIVDGKLLNRAAATLGKMDGVLGQLGKPDSAPTLTEGRRPGTGALRFDADEFDLVRIPATDAKALDGLEQFTIALWVKPDNTDQHSHHLLTWRNQNQNALNFVAVWNGSPDALDQWAVADAALFNTSQITSRINNHQSSPGSLHRDGQWMHLVVTFDRGQRSIYLDGKSIASLASSGPHAIVGLNEDLLIGAAKPHLNTPQSYLDGDLDELFILGRAMSADEISNLYEKEANQP
jgi:anti-sigma factor RsiW